MLSWLEDAFLIRLVPIDSASERQRQVNPRKVYPVDSGLMPVFDRSGKANTGHVLETAVLIELERRRHQVAYGKTPNGKEVDFIDRSRDGQTVYIQVCAELNTTEVCRRKIEPLSEILTAKPTSNCLLLTLTTTDVAIAQKVAPNGVTVRPAWEWLLEEVGG